MCIYRDEGQVLDTGCHYNKIKIRQMYIILIWIIFKNSVANNKRIYCEIPK